MKTLEHVFIHSRWQFSMHGSGDFAYPFEPTVGDLVQTTDPVISKVVALSQP